MFPLGLWNMNEHLQSQMMWQIMLDRTMRMHTDFRTSARINERRLVFLGQGYRSGLLKEKGKKSPNQETGLDNMVCLESLIDT